MIDSLNLGPIYDTAYTLLEWIPDLLGCLGAGVILFAYWGLQTNRIKADCFNYLFLNFVGAVLILISLLFAWNLAAVAMEFAWMVISIVGILKLKRQTV